MYILVAVYAILLIHIYLFTTNRTKKVLFFLKKLHCQIGQTEDQKTEKENEEKKI